MNPLENLQERLAERRVVVIVGAGVSIAATGGDKVASWKGLLESGIDRCADLLPELRGRWVERRREDLDMADVVSWISVATQVQERLTGVAPGEFRLWLEDTIGKLTVSRSDVLDALRDLQVPVATTNYDSLLEDVLGRPPVTWRDFPRVQRVLQGDEEAVIHLHGHFKEPESVVFGYPSYTKLVGDRAAQALQQTLRANFSLLYMGFGASFQDPNFASWLKWARETFRGEDTYRHYRLCRSEEQESVQAEHPGDDRIFALPYGEHHEDLIPFLRNLVPAPEQRQPVEERLPSAGLPPTDWLLGRDQELIELVDHVCGEGPAPVPLLGGPGMGKTALSVHAFRHPAVVTTYGDRRYFVRCDGVADAAALPGAIASVMNLAITGDPRRALLQAMHGKRTFLVLDTFETPWETDPMATEAFLSELAALSDLSLVVSVRGLQRPQGVPWRQSFEIGKLDPEPAEELFHKITQDAHRGDSDLPEVLRLLDGVPLAIRLMAHAAEARPSLAWLLDAWTLQRTALLSRGKSRGKDDDLEVSIALSLDGPRLNDPAKQLASGLAILPDGLAFEDLDGVYTEAGRDAAALLVGVGLAFYEGDRLRMLSPVREAVQSLRPLSEGDVKTWVTHYLDLARELGALIGGPGGRESIARLEPEIGNLETCFQLALDGVDLDAAFSSWRGLSLLRQFQNIGSPRLLLKASQVAKTEDRPMDEANCFYDLGAIALERSEHDTARQHYDKALPLFQRVGDVLGEANCIQGLGDIALERSEHDTARQHYDKALPLYRRVGSVLGEANCILSLGYIALRRSEHDTARQHYDKALPLYRRVGDVLGEANCIQRLGDIALADDEVAKAEEHWRSALGLYQRISEPYSIGMTHSRLALAATEPSDRLHHAERARQAWRSIDRLDLVKKLDEALAAAEAE